MKATFPHCGSAWVPLKTLFAKYGIECIIPPRASKRTISLGVKHSPEWICFPYKILLGNIIEGLEMGADTVVSIGGPGLCRLGYYSKLHLEALKSLGYNFDMVLFDWQEGGIVAMGRFIRKLVGPKEPWGRIIGDIKFGLFGQLLFMENLERKVHWVRPRELEQGAVNRVWRSAGDRIAAAATEEELKETRAQILREIDAIPLDPKAKPLKVGFLGEFFMAIDPASNLGLEEELGKLGVEVHRAAYLMNWAQSWLFLAPLGISHHQKVSQAARPYLKRDVSGDAVQSLGETILHQKEGYDGIVHIMPFTCMPEITAQNIFPRLAKDHQIPILTVTIDEQMGKAGLITRLEAFADLMARRRAAAARG
ncbi:MAG: CoA protein activase [Chloroflexi bacterium]|nr:CoA protein activase [Chloroflexota bacterium]